MQAIGQGGSNDEPSAHTLQERCDAIFLADQLPDLRDRLDATVQSASDAGALLALVHRDAPEAAAPERNNLFFNPVFATAAEIVAYQQMTAELQQYDQFTQGDVASFLQDVDALPRGAVVAAGAQESLHRQAEVQLLADLSTAVEASALGHKTWLLWAADAAWRDCGEGQRRSLLDETWAAVQCVRFDARLLHCWMSGQLRYADSIAMSLRIRPRYMSTYIAVRSQILLHKWLWRDHPGRAHAVFTIMPVVLSMMGNHGVSFRANPALVPNRKPQADRVPSPPVPRSLVA